MTNIDSYRHEVLLSLAASRYEEAFVGLDNIAAAIQAPASLRDETERLRENYRLLKGYALDGIDDPRRAQVLADIAAGVRRSLERFVRYERLKESPMLYYSTIRYENLQCDSSIAQLSARFAQLLSESGMALINGGTDEAIRTEVEQLRRRLFKLVWTAFPLTDADARALTEFVGNPAVAAADTVQIINAVLLGALIVEDPRRAEWLAMVYDSSENPQIQVAALCALMLTLMRWWHDERPPKVANAVAVISERRGWAEDIRMVCKLILRTADTDRVTRKVNEELLPGMLKHKEELDETFRNLSADDLEALGEGDINPEWEEKLRKSGIADKLREFSELQADGADVMMSTFSKLKGYAFFNEISNWFLPFRADEPQIAQSPLPKEFLEMLESVSVFCDSDKYSLVLSARQVPDSMRKVMVDQMKAAEQHIAEMQSATLDPSRADRETIGTRFLQNLYRFFKIFNRHDEFINPFADKASLILTARSIPALATPDNMRLLGEFYFKRGYDSQAAMIFRRLVNDGENDPQIYQKLGYLYQAMGNYAAAIEMFGNADLINSDDVWTLRHLAQAQMQQERWTDALVTYRRLEKLRPDEAAIALKIAQNLMEIGEHQEAIRALYKADFLRPEHRPTLSLMAWARLLTGDYNRASEIFERLLAENPSATDLLNAGHLAMARRQWRKAVDLYRRSIAEQSKEKFVDAFEEDTTNHPQLFPDRIMIDLVMEESLK